MFAFSQIQPEQPGEVTDMPVSIGDYLGASVEQGMHDSMFGELYRSREQSLEEQDPAGKTIQPDEANTRFGLPGLQFDEPVKVGVAQLLKERHQAQMDRNFFLTQDNHSLVTSAIGMGAEMAGSMMNPLDLGAMFLPVVGEEAKLAEGANILGRGAMVRASINRGLISHAEIAASFPSVPKLATSMIQGTSYAAMAEIPKQMQARAELQEAGDPMADIFQGALFAGGMHLALSAAGRLWESLGIGTKIAAFKKGMDDFAKGNDIDVSSVVKLDPLLAQEQAHQYETESVAWANKKYEAAYQDQGVPTGEAAVPVTEGEPEKRQYSSALDEIRQTGSRTIQQIQDLFPEAKLSREQARAWRKQAWNEPDIDSTDQQHWDNVQEAIAKAKETDAEGNATRQRQKENKEAAYQAQLGKYAEEKGKDSAADPVAPTAIEESKKTDQAKAAKDEVKADNERRKERVVGTASRLDDGTVIRGKNPNSLHATLEQDWGESDKNTGQVVKEQGFITSEGRFVGREEAAQLSQAGIKSLGAEHLTKSGNLSKTNVELQKQFDAETRKKNTAALTIPEIHGFVKQLKDAEESAKKPVTDAIKSAADCIVRKGIS